MLVRWAIAACALAAINLSAQSITSGAIAGTVTDPTAAAVANTTVTAKNQATSTLGTTQTNSEGVYRFSFLGPGTYEITVSATGFRRAQQTAAVSIGQTSKVDFRLVVGEAKESVKVSGEAPLLELEHASLVTSVPEDQIENTPNPGNDLTFVVQTSPGVVMNTQQGLGSFSSYGLPATSNVFTVNGMPNNNPFLNLNNAGATNLLLGLGEVEELTVTNNPYSGEYGGLAGAQVNVVTKSGTNAWHGDASYWWNGRVLNANDWFNNHTQPKTDRSFDNANQWSAGLGGPIEKDKTFFFLYTEGLRVVIPTSNQVLVPSPEFEAATVSNLNGMGLTNSANYYQNVIFPLYNAAPGVSAATALPFNSQQNGGCGGSTFPGGLGTTVPCALQFQSTTNNLSSEWILALRLDHTLGEKDRLFGRFRTDHGTQATYTDPINSAFNIEGDQPQFEGQLGETHTFNSAAANNLVVSGSWLGLTESNPNRARALSLFPTTLSLGDGTLATLGGIDNLFPQGRNSTQYGFVDDATLVHGRDSFKFGVTYQRYDITDLDYPILSSGIVVPFTLQEFFFGGNIPGSPAPGDLLVQNFITRPTQPLASYRLGWYVQDERRLRSNLNVTFSLRMDHDSIPVCQTDCFSLLAGNFADLSRDVTTPYKNLIQTRQHQAYRDSDAVVWQPRLGIAWQPLANHNLVVHAGGGIFSDAFPAAIADRIGANPPLVNGFNVRGDFLAPTETSNLFSDAAHANAAFVSGYAGGASFADFLNPTSPFFSPFFIPPNFENPPTRARIPRYEEWSLDVQKGWGADTMMKIAYVGSHGIYELVQNNGVNGFCAAQVCPFGFAGLPNLPPDPRFGTVNQLQTSGVSNYNGMTATVQHRVAHGLQVLANYTWSHAFDDVSNGGFLNFNFGTNNSLLDQVDPNNVRRFNYASADYDVRNYFSLNSVYDVPFKRAGLAGWQLSGVVFLRGGLPFSVIDSTTTNLLNEQNYGGTILANPLGAPPSTCGGSAAGLDSKPCLTAGQFSPTPNFFTAFPSGFGNQRRNQFRGPGYFDSDIAITKSTTFPHWERGAFTAGVQLFNWTNHANFDQPVANIADPRLGHIIRTVSTPTTVLGSFLGGDASPRVVRIVARITF